MCLLLPAGNNGLQCVYGTQKNNPFALLSEQKD